MPNSKPAEAGKGRQAACHISEQQRGSARKPLSITARIAHSIHHLRLYHMASSYHSAVGTYETSLIDPPAKRSAGPNEFGICGSLSDDSSSVVHQYATPDTSGHKLDLGSVSHTSSGFFAAPKAGSREASVAGEHLSYSYALSSGSSSSTENSPFSILQHPAFADSGTREPSAGVSALGKDRTAENAAQRHSYPLTYHSAHQQQGNDTNERILGPSELLPPSSCVPESAPQPSFQAPFSHLSQVPLNSGHYPPYVMPNQYSQFPGLYVPTGAGAQGATYQAGSSSLSPALSSASPPSPSSAAQQQFSVPLRRPDLSVANRNLFIPRRHSIAVPSPGHNFSLWPGASSSSFAPESHEWPSSSRSSFTLDDSEGTARVGDDGSDSEGEGPTVMVSLRSKDLPPGGPVIEGKFISLLVGPGEHQVKDFNILPINVLRINYESKSSDYIVVHLVCDLKMKRTTREIFMAAVSAHHLMHDHKRAILPALKISQQMLRGRTKGFLFQLRYTLVVDGQEVESLHSEPFYLWSNVSQRSFPRHEREAYAVETQDINTRKRRRR